MSEAGGSGARLTDAQRLDWLRLIRTDSIGPQIFRGLINRFGGAAAALDAAPRVAAQKGLQTGDVILSVGGKTVSRPSEVTAALESAKADGKKSVLMQVKTENGTHFVAMSTQVS